VSLATIAYSFSQTNAYSPSFLEIGCVHLWPGHTVKNGIGSFIRKEEAVRGGKGMVPSLLLSKKGRNHRVKKMHFVFSE
jgi:hypothetical protein